jgi:hypothetical protein
MKLKWTLRVSVLTLAIVSFAILIYGVIELMAKNTKLERELKETKYWYSKTCELVIESADIRYHDAIENNHFYFYGASTGFAGTTLPGFGLNDESRNKYETILLYGNGCRGSPPEEIYYDLAANKYAEEFNLKMHYYMKSKTQK